MSPSWPLVTAHSPCHSWRAGASSQSLASIATWCLAYVSSVLVRIPVIWIQDPPYSSIASSSLIKSATILFVSKVTFSGSGKDVTTKQPTLMPTHLSRSKCILLDNCMEWVHCMQTLLGTQKKYLYLFYIQSI